MTEKCMEGWDLNTYIKEKQLIVLRRTNTHILLLDPIGNKVPLSLVFDWPMLISAETGREKATAFIPPLGSGLLPDEGPVCIIDRRLANIRGYGYARRIGDTRYKVYIEHGGVNRWDYIDFLLAVNIKPPIKTLLTALESLRPSILILFKLFTTISPKYALSVLTSRMPHIAVIPCIKNRPLISPSNTYICVNFEGKPPRTIEIPRNMLNNIPSLQLGI